MSSFMSPARLLLAFGSIAVFSLAKIIAATDWREGYIVYEDSKSPDDRYAVLIPSRDAAEEDESLGSTNYFADLKNHRLMGKIAGADYFEHQNHRGLRVTWAPDSSWCIVEYEDRFGFGSISIVQPKGSSFTQTDIGQRIKKSLAIAIDKQSPGSDSGGGDAGAYFRIGADGKLSVRALSTTDPKEFDLKHAHFALFYGTYDLRSNKWLGANARALDYGEYNGADSVFGDIDEEMGRIAREEDKLESLDISLNGVYGVLRAILPAARFAEIKKEQIEWLKKRDAAGSVEEKNKLIQARIKTLQQLVW
jgi:hypothetical protein